MINIYTLSLNVDRLIMQHSIKISRQYGPAVEKVRNSAGGLAVAPGVQ